MSRMLILAVAALGAMLALASAALGAVVNKDAIQNAMIRYVDTHTSENGLMPVMYEGKVLQLKVVKSEKYPTGFHAGVKNEGALYTSCADFRDPISGTKYDIDFLVQKVGDAYEVVQPIVHRINGMKNPYDLSQISLPWRPY